MTAEDSVLVLPTRPSKHFTWEEFACDDAVGTPYPIDWRVSRGVPLAVELERIRTYTGPLTLTSVYRTWSHHQGIYSRMRPPQAAPAGSQHLAGRAADVACPTSCSWDEFVAVVRLVAALKDSQIRYVKCYRRQRFVHVDIRVRKTVLVEYDS